MCHKGEPVIQRADQQATRVDINGRQGLCFQVGQIKVRAIDPTILIGEALRPLSEIEPEFARQREAHIAARGQPKKLFVHHGERGEEPPNAQVA